MSWPRFSRHSCDAIPRIVVRPVNGLANRLRAITSSLALARHLGLGFAVHWGPSDCFSDEPWDALFGNRFPQLSEKEYRAELESGAPRVSDWLLRGPERPAEIAPGFDSAEVLGAVRSRGLIYDFGYQHIDSQLREAGVKRLGRCRRIRRRLCREMVPALSIARRVDAFASERFRGHEVIGVHVRRGDALQSRYAEHYKRSSDEVFEAAMARQVARRADVRFFLATDCEETQAAFQTRFGDRLITFHKEFSPSEVLGPKEGQADAVAEMWLLSRTTSILGTEASTFGRMASLIGGLPYRTAT